VDFLGKFLLDNTTKLKEFLLSNKEDGCDSKVEHWGKLLSWWKVVDRAYSFHSIFNELRKARSVKGPILEARFQEYVNLALSDQIKKKLISYSSACRYDRLGKFLLSFPKFVYQLEFVTLVDALDVVKYGRAKGLEEWKSPT
jgi:hypothetical protein